MLPEVCGKNTTTSGQETHIDAEVAPSPVELQAAGGTDKNIVIDQSDAVVEIAQVQCEDVVCDNPSAKAHELKFYDDGVVPSFWQSQLFGHLQIFTSILVLNVIWIFSKVFRSSDPMAVKVVFGFIYFVAVQLQNRPMIWQLFSMQGDVRFGMFNGYMILNAFSSAVEATISFPKKQRGFTSVVISFLLFAYLACDKGKNGTNRCLLATAGVLFSLVFAMATSFGVPSLTVLESKVGSIAWPMAVNAYNALYAPLFFRAVWPRGAPHSCHPMVLSSFQAVGRCTARALLLSGVLLSAGRGQLVLGASVGVTISQGLLASVAFMVSALLGRTGVWSGFGRWVLGNCTAIDAREDLILRCARLEMAMVVWVFIYFAIRSICVFMMPGNLVGGSAVLVSGTTWASLAIAFVACMSIEVGVAVIHAKLRAIRRGDAMPSLTPGNIWKMHSLLALPDMHESLVPKKNVHKDPKLRQEKADDAMLLGSLRECTLLPSTICYMYPMMGGIMSAHFCLTLLDVMYVKVG